ncbi:MAG TPA: hypothetical protein V6D09_04515 [Leptolyngbyaceae cyanobacterium]
MNVPTLATKKVEHSSIQAFKNITSNKQHILCDRKEQVKFNSTLAAPLGFRVREYECPLYKCMGAQAL